MGSSASRRTAISRGSALRLTRSSRAVHACCSCPNAHLTARQLLVRLLAHERAIRRLVDRDDGPWIAVVQQGGLERLALDG